MQYYIYSANVKMFTEKVGEYMKKFLTSVLLFALIAVVSVSAFACGGSSWKQSDVTLNDWGAVVENGGFIAETENYVYYINGTGDSANDNSFGTPVKGALVAAKKSDIESGKSAVEKCIVVPKLFVAQDYKAGVYINGDYVYYATPSTDKTSSGGVASGEIQFMKTKLDGSSSESLLKAGAMSDQYRIFESGGKVYIIVYDSANKTLLSYNTSDKTQIEIAKTDEKTESGESLNTYLFADADYAKDGVVVFSTTVYTEAYDENAAASNSSYSRATASYNKVYVYKAGDEQAKLVLDGKETNSSYSLTRISGEYFYYTATVSPTMGEGSPVYAVKVADFYSGDAGERVYNADYITSTNIVVSPTEIYTLNSTTGIVKRVSLKDNAKANEKNVAKVGTSATLLFVDGGYLYYYNESTELLRIKLNDFSAKYEKISDGAVSSSWYVPEIHNGYAYYSDASAEGCGYVKTVSVGEDNLVAVDADGKKTEDTDEIDHYYFDGSVSLGIFSEEDSATAIGEKINSITSSLDGGKLKFDTDDNGNVVEDESGLPVIAKIAEVKDAYGALTEDGKKQISEGYATFKNYEKAYELSRTLYKLNDFDKLSKTEKDAKKSAYEEAKAALSSIKKDGFDESAIKALCAKNLMWFYQTANTYFAG